jgi:prephenate dehydrogenase
VRAQVIGLGLIGGSVGMALRQIGWHVTGADHDEPLLDRAVDLGAIDRGGLDPAAEITFVATPPGTLASAVRHSLAATTGIVTDVGSVKAPVVAAIDDPRFVGGHPMAGSELVGLDGADASMFRGAVWVLTPTTATSGTALARVGAIVRSMGAETVAVPPDAHDRLVAVISHVPHLTAATLMNLASDRSLEHAALLKLAAGGFRDMTRVASGHPAIWPDICDANRDAIVATLDDLIDGLDAMRSAVADRDRDRLAATLGAARAARTNLPSRAVQPDAIAEVRIPIPDRPGAAAEIFTLAAELSVNVVDFEVAHSAEGDRGVAVLVVDVDATELFRGGLIARGFRPSVSKLT